MWHIKDIYKIERELNTNFKTGLKEKDINNLQKKYGLNKLLSTKKESLFVKFIKQFKDFMIIILLASALISFITSYINKTNDYIDAIIIMAIVIFNALMGVIQESKAEKSIEALKKMFSPLAKVKRDGKYLEIDTTNLVPGDIILLETGKLVPADCRIISSNNLYIDESILTGETVPSEKKCATLKDEKIPTADIINMAFTSTIITGGTGEAVVTDIGMNTKLGKIAGMLSNKSAEDTPLQRKLAGLGKILGVVTIIICLIIFFIGMSRNEPPLEMFMTSVGLAVASIPEGMPAIVTILLSIGITKMAKQNAIIRKLPAVETLGSSSIICSDKTGTLTQNKMTVKKTYGDENKLIEYMSLCTDSIITNENNRQIVKGDPSENALVEYSLSKNISKDILQMKMPRVNEIPFDSDRKLMTTIHKLDNGYLIITKGAPDVLIKRCSCYLQGEKSIKLDNNRINEIIKENETMAINALRVLGFAFKVVDNLPSSIKSETIEFNLCFIGLVGMIDPPREGVKEAVLNAKKAGIKTVMITGDHILTAKTIAKDLKILDDNSLAISGSELDNMSDATLEKNIMKYSVFARVSPEHKVRIVNAFKKQGKVVAMTGDGVNDAPALKAASIGVAMGKGGTDVAKSASDMILTDDNFVTIIKAVKEGRHIYSNIKKAIHFLLATNIGEIVTMFLALLLKLDTPLLAIHLLWINLVTDSLPAIALGMEKAENDIMKKSPINPKKSIFSDGLGSKIVTEGLMIGILNLTIYCIFLSRYSLEAARTASFVSLGLTELIHSFNIKSSKSILNHDVFNNKYLILSFIVGVLLQVSVVIFKPIASVFKITTLNLNQWSLIIMFSLIPVVLVELQKLLTNINKRSISFNDFTSKKNE